MLQSLSSRAPICSQRTHQMNVLMGLDDITAPTQPLVAAEETTAENNVFDLPPYYPGGSYTGGGDFGGGGYIGGFPYLPGFPGGYTGPVIVTPGIPVISPPAAVPEPASWATMMLGMAFVGGSIRRRRRPVASR